MGIAGDFVLIVIAGLVGGLAARALGLPLLVGYVAAGVVVGPHTAGPTVANVQDIEVLSEIGVALLLFALGLEVSFRDLRAVRGVALVGGPLQIVVTSALGALVGWAVVGMRSPDVWWFGAMVALSSTMVVLKTLAATGTLSTLASRVMIGVLVVQDLAVVPMLILLPQLGNTADLGVRLLRAALIAAVFVAGMVVVGTRLLPALLRRIAGWGSRELFLVAVVAAGIGIGSIAHAAGLSFAIGAFVAGIVLSESELSHQALSDVGPLRDIFGLLFFVTVGMLFDPQYLLGHAGDVALVVAAIIVGKALICGGIAHLFGYRNLAPWVVGLGLAQVGEFGFVLARTGRAGGFISAETYDLSLTCTVLSMALSPLVFPGLLPAARAWRRWWGPAVPPLERSQATTTLDNHVVVAGYGRTGQAIVSALRGAEVPYVVVEARHDVVAHAIELGEPFVWGDITSDDVLKAAHIQDARMIVMAVHDWSAIRLGIDRARALNSRLFVVARATTAAHVGDLNALRVDSVVQPEFEGGLAMVHRALEACDRTDDDIERLLADLRQRHYGSDVPQG